MSALDIDVLLARIVAYSHNASIPGDIGALRCHDSRDVALTIFGSAERFRLLADAALEMADAIDDSLDKAAESLARRQAVSQVIGRVAESQHLRAFTSQNVSDVLGVDYFRPDAS